jgi:excisionase family DNA binding protein
MTDPLSNDRAKLLSSGSIIQAVLIDPLLTAREGADLLKISIPTFWRWVANGTLPKAVKMGGMSRWPQSELLAFVDRAKAKRTAA